jgi:hypothetical protein
MLTAALDPTVAEVWTPEDYEIAERGLAMSAHAEKTDFPA